MACGKEDGDDNRPLEAMFGESSGWEDEIIDKVDWESSVGHLHPHMAQVVKLRSEGLTQREIANVLGCSQGNVSRMEAILRREWEMKMKGTRILLDPSRSSITKKL